MNILHRVLPALLLAMYAGAPAQAGYYVARTGANSDTSPYTSSTTAASNIQHAVNAATNNATVWIGAGGPYTAPTDGVVYDGITNVVYLNKPLTLRGATGNPADVLIDGQGTNRGINIYYNTSTADRFVIKDLTISNSWNHGLLLHAAANGIIWTGVVENCVVTHTASGTGIRNNHYNGPRTVIVSDSVVRYSAGRGFENYSAINEPMSIITDTVFEHNAGGGLSFHRGTHTFDRCIVRHNDSGSAAGGAFTIGVGTFFLYNCLIYDNFAGGFGGAIYKWSATGPMDIHNSTIVSNRSTAGPGGIRSSATNPIVNSILRFNYAGANISDWYAFGGTSFTNSNSTGTMPGANNISTAPQFMDLSGFDFRLQEASPCVNSGTNLPWMTGATDLVGFRRIDRAHNQVDMGCYEYPFRLGTVITVQ